VTGVLLVLFRIASFWKGITVSALGAGKKKHSKMDPAAAAETEDTLLKLDVVSVLKKVTKGWKVERPCALSHNGLIIWNEISFLRYLWQKILNVNLHYRICAPSAK
jgi:hypothetical protein